MLNTVPMTTPIAPKTSVCGAFYCDQAAPETKALPVSISDTFLAHNRAARRTIPSPMPSSVAIARQEQPRSRSAATSPRSTLTLFLPSALHRLPRVDVNQPGFCSSSLRRSRPPCWRQSSVENHDCRRVERHRPPEQEDALRQFSGKPLQRVSAGGQGSLRRAAVAGLDG
jgi:hypothetical protein